MKAEQAMWKAEEQRKSADDAEKKTQEQKQAQEQQEKLEKQRKSEQVRQQAEQQKAQKVKESKADDKKKSGRKLTPVTVTLAGVSLAELREMTKTHLASLGPTMMGEKTITNDRTVTREETVQESQSIGHMLTQSLFEENMQKIDQQESQTQGIHL
ncbi:MAG: hypothetical protein PUD15_08615 [Prevotella sp.]|nr:hypothetical protein [Prevotella sp.]